MTNGSRVGKALLTNMRYSSQEANEMLETTLQELSREYYQFVESFTKSDFEDEKILGKFYTDLGIAKSMMDIINVHHLKENFLREISIIDPFCGDGRLVIELLNSLGKRYENNDHKYVISIWDIDYTAVNEARNAIEDFCEKHRLSYKIDARVADAFVEYAEMQEKFDICVTNPPWSLLKPQKLFNKSNTEDTLNEYRNAIEKYDEYMKKEFPLSQPSSKFGKWGTNLARCGTEIALRLVKHDGVAGIVSPASLLNDQVSGRLRKWIFENHRVIDISYYPAELKLYGNADISSVTLVVKGGKTDQKLSVKIYSERDYYKEEKIEKEVFEYIKSNVYSIPLQTGIDAIPIMMYLDKLPTVLSYCNESGLAFTREMDETRFKEKLTQTGRIEFAKGYMVDRYSFSGDSLYIDEDKVTIPASVLKNKIVWRDVSRDSQLRRIKATLLKPGYMCGNSLGVIFGDFEHLDMMKMLLAIMNSLISNHVAAGIVKNIHVPRPKINRKIVTLVDRQLSGEDVEVEIEIAVAKLYGLSPNEYRLVLSRFDYPEDIKNILAEKYAEIQNNGEIVI